MVRSVRLDLSVLHQHVIPRDPTLFSCRKPLSAAFNPILVRFPRRRFLPAVCVCFHISQLDHERMNPSGNTLSVQLCHHYGPVGRFAQSWIKEQWMEHASSLLYQENDHYWKRDHQMDGTGWRKRNVKKGLVRIIPPGHHLMDGRLGDSRMNSWVLGSKVALVWSPLM